MPFWSKNKVTSSDGKTSPVKPIINDSLVAKLVSDISADLTCGLQQAVDIAERGDYEGIEAMREAIKLRSGKKEVNFYEAGLRIGNGEDFYKRKEDAPKKILELAKKHALLKDLYYSGDLITAVMSFFEADSLRNLLMEIFKVGGTREAFNFQLVYNEIRCTSKINKLKS